MTKKAKHIIDPELTTITLQYVTGWYQNVEDFDSFDFDSDDYEYRMKMAELDQDASEKSRTNAE